MKKNKIIIDTLLYILYNICIRYFEIEGGNNMSEALVFIVGVIAITVLLIIFGQKTKPKPEIKQEEEITVTPIDDSIHETTYQVSNERRDLGRRTDYVPGVSPINPGRRQDDWTFAYNMWLQYLKNDKVTEAQFSEFYQEYINHTVTKKPKKVKRYVFQKQN